MEVIKLKKHHRIKLLKMCKVLFPEMYIGFNLIPRPNVGNEDLYYYPRGTSRKRKYIHWFEFCTTTLTREILILKTNKDFGFDPWDFDKAHKKTLIKMFMYDEPEHPIDYLYKEFLKLKQ